MSTSASLQIDVLTAIQDQKPSNPPTVVSLLIPPPSTKGLSLWMEVPQNHQFWGPTHISHGNSRGCASSCISINSVFCIQRRLHRSGPFQIADIAECCFIREVLMIAVALPNLEKARGLYSSYRLRAGENRSHLHNRALRKQHEL